MGDPDDGRLTHCRVLVEQLLDLARVDVEPVRMIMSFLRSTMKK